MGSLAIIGKQAVPASNLQLAYFDDFIRYIDRPGSTQKTYITNLRQFAAWLRFMAICRPVRDDIIAYRDYLEREHDAIQLDAAAADGWSYRTDTKGKRYTVACRPSTVKIYLQSVRQFFAWTASAGLYPDVAANVHTRKIRQDRHKKEALEPSAVLTIEKSIQAAAAERISKAGQASKDAAGRAERAAEQGARLYAIYMLAVNAGLRTVEISRANVKDLQVKDGRAVLWVWGKGHAEPDTKKPLAPAVYEAIRHYLDIRQDRPTGASPLFVSTGNRSGGQRMATTTISRLLKAAMIQAGYDSERITAHSLRHTAGNCVMSMTGNLYTTQAYMRHESPVTTEIYLHQDTERLEDQTARQLYNLYHGQERQDVRERLQDMLQGMNTDQLEQLAAVAAMMRPAAV